jgi:predicted nucleotidyltransferase
VAIDADPSDIEALRRILHEQIPEYEVWVFGSRVLGNARPFSDLDLLLVAREPLPAPRLVVLKEALSHSRLPFKVDLVEWSRISDEFRAIIRQTYEVLQRPEASRPLPGDG